MSETKIEQVDLEAVRKGEEQAQAEMLVLIAETRKRHELAEKQKYTTKKSSFAAENTDKIKKTVAVDESQNTYHCDPQILCHLKQFEKLKKAFTLIGGCAFKNFSEGSVDLFGIRDQVDLPIKTYLKSKNSKYITDDGFYMVLFNDEKDFNFIAETFEDGRLANSSTHVIVTQHYTEKSRSNASAFQIKTMPKKFPKNLSKSDENEISDHINKSIDSGFKFVSSYFDNLGKHSQCDYCHDTSLTKTRNHSIQNLLENTFVVIEDGYTHSTSELRNKIFESRNDEFHEDDYESEDFTISAKLSMNSVISPNGRTIVILRNDKKPSDTILESIYQKIRKRRLSFLQPQETYASIYIGDLLYTELVMSLPEYQRNYKKSYKRFSGCGDKLDYRVYGAPISKTERHLTMFRHTVRANNDENYISDTSELWKQYASDNIRNYDTELYEGDNITCFAISENPYIKVFSTRPLTKLVIDEIVCKANEGDVKHEAEIEEITIEENGYKDEFKHMIVEKDFKHIQERCRDLRVVEDMAATHLCQNCQNISGLSRTDEYNKFFDNGYKNFLLSARNLDIDTFCYKTSRNQNPDTRSINVDDALVSQILGSDYSKINQNFKSESTNELIENNDLLKIWHRKNLDMKVIEFKHRLPFKVEDDSCLIVTEPNVTVEQVYHTMVDANRNPKGTIEVDTWRFTNGMHRMYSALKTRSEYRCFDDEEFEDKKPEIQVSNQERERRQGFFGNIWDLRGDLLSSGEYGRFMETYQERFAFPHTKSSSLNYHYPKPGEFTEKRAKKARIQRQKERVAKRKIRTEQLRAKIEADKRRAKQDLKIFQEDLFLQELREGKKDETYDS